VESFGHVSRLLPDKQGLRRAGDFTNLVEGRPPVPAELGARPVAIVPNAMMLVHGSEGMRRAYVPFMALCAAHLKEAGLDPFILIHEAEFDREIAREIQVANSGTIPEVSWSDPIVIKGLLGRCLVTVGSRFHGLVSALSQGVPSIGTGWSHKYKALFVDYGRDEWLVNPVEDQGRGLRLIDTLLANQTTERAQLLARSARLKADTEAMWQEVEELLVRGARGRKPARIRNMTDDPTPALALNLDGMRQL
jgi:colanic acid/amylovoran biosynthesis protein